MTTYGVKEYGLILNILKSFGNLESIFSLPSINKSNSILYTSRSYEREITRRGFVNVYIYIGVIPTNGRVADTSSKRDLASELTQTHKNTNVVDFINKESFHGHGNGKEAVLWCVYIQLNLLYIM